VNHRAADVSGQTGRIGGESQAGPARTHQGRQMDHLPPTMLTCSSVIASVDRNRTLTVTDIDCRNTCASEFLVTDDGHSEIEESARSQR
jgi:hypothetical protein